MCGTSPRIESSNRSSSALSRAFNPAAGSSRQSSDRIGAHGAGDLEPPLLAIGEGARGIVGAAHQADAVQPVGGSFDRSALGVAIAAGAPISPSKVKPEACISGLCCATTRFSSTVMPGNRRMFWKVRADLGELGDAEVEQALERDETRRRHG